MVFDGGFMVVDVCGEFIFRVVVFKVGLFLVFFDVENKLVLCLVLVVFDLLKEVSVYSVLVLVVKDYVNKNGFKGVVLGLFGGVDFVLILVVVVDVFGVDWVEVVMMLFCYIL